MRKKASGTQVLKEERLPRLRLAMTCFPSLREAQAKIHENVVFNSLDLRLPRQPRCLAMTKGLPLQQWEEKIF